MSTADANYADYVNHVLARGPRCGCIDAANLGESFWGLATVAWGVSSFPTGLSQDRVLQLYQQAFDSWSAVCGLKFTRVAAADANIVIGTGRGSRSNFDGPNGTLAWAYLPSGRNFRGRLEVRFDLDETWIDNPQARGILLLNVACHEFGHAIGLSHITNVSNQLLNPYYSAAISKPQSEDARQVQTLYGKPVATPAPTPTPTPTPTDPAAPVSDVIAMKWQHRNGDVYGASVDQPIRKLPANGLVGQEWSW